MKAKKTKRLFAYDLFTESGLRAEEEPWCDDRNTGGGFVHEVVVVQKFKPKFKDGKLIIPEAK